MESYSVLIKPSAAREIEAVPVRERKRIVTRIRSLAREPRPPGVEKLSGLERYRLRQGSYRVLFSIDDKGRTVVIVKIGHRRDVYR